MDLIVCVVIFPGRAPAQGKGMGVSRRSQKRTGQRGKSFPPLCWGTRRMLHSGSRVFPRRSDVSAPDSLLELLEKTTAEKSYIEQMRKFRLYV